MKKFTTTLSNLSEPGFIKEPSTLTAMQMAKKYLRWQYDVNPYKGLRVEGRADYLTVVRNGCVVGYIID